MLKYSTSAWKCTTYFAVHTKYQTDFSENTWKSNLFYIKYSKFLKLYSQVDLRSIFCFITEQFWNREFHLVQVVWVQMLNLIILGFNFKFNTSNTVFMHLSICRCAKVLHCKHGKFPKNGKCSLFPCYQSEVWTKISVRFYRKHQVDLRSF